MSVTVTTNIPVDNIDDGVATDYLTTVEEVSTGSDTTLALVWTIYIDDVGYGSSDELPSAHITTHLAEVATADDGVVDVGTFQLLEEIAYGRDTVASRRDLHSTIAEVARGADTVSGRNDITAPTLAEEATADDSVSYTLTIRGSLSEVAYGSDAIAAHITRTTTLAETAEAVDTVAGNITSVLVESATAEDSASVHLRTALAEAAIAADTLSTIVSSQNRLVEVATAADTVAAIVSTISSLAEVAYAADTLYNLPVGSNGDDVWSTNIWTANIENWAMSRYTDWQPHEVGSDWAVGPGGVYRKAAAAVDAYIETGDMDLTSRGDETRMLWIDVDASAETDLALALTALRSRFAPASHTYTETPGTDRVEILKYKIGRKLRGDRWRIRVQNPSGGDFRVLRLILHPVLTV